jgi:hypothetical protein
VATKISEHSVQYAEGFTLYLAVGGEREEKIRLEERLWPLKSLNILYSMLKVSQCIWQ